MIGAYQITSPDRLLDLMQVGGNHSPQYRMVLGDNRSPEGFRKWNLALLFEPAQPTTLVIENPRVADRVPEACRLPYAGLMFYQYAVELSFDPGCVPIDDIHFDTSFCVIPFVAQIPELQVQI